MRVLTGDQLCGDLIMLTPAIRNLRLQNPDQGLVYHVPREHSNVHISGNHVLLQNSPYLDAVFVGSEFVPAEDDLVIPMRPMNAYNWAVVNGKTIPEGFAQLVGLGSLDSLKYDYWMEPEEVDNQLERMHELCDGKPIVIVARHSASCTSNDPKIGQPNKCIPNKHWVEFANWLLKEGFMPVAVGSAKEEKDVRYKEWPGKHLYGLPIREVAAIISRAHATISIDTGIRHLAAAVGCNMACLSGIIPLSVIHCEPVQEDQRIYEEVCPVAAVTTSHLIRIAGRVL